jgi:hypothetical protein
MGRMLGSYLLGFGTVWASVLLACVAAWAVRRRRGTDWDFAFVTELEKDTDLAGSGFGTRGDAELL